MKIESTWQPVCCQVLFLLPGRLTGRIFIFHSEFIYLLDKPLQGRGDKVMKEKQGSGMKRNYFRLLFSHRLRIQLHYLLFFAAVELVLAFSWLGFINFEFISLTTLHIPVLLAALFLGKWAGAFVGGVFGLLSMWKASNIVFSAADLVFSPTQSGDPLGSLVTALGTRVLFGFLAGWLYEQLRGRDYQELLMGLATYLLTWLHGVLVFSALGVFFPFLGVDFYSGLMRFFSWPSFVSAGVSAVLVMVIWSWCKYTALGHKFIMILLQNSNAVFYEENVKGLLSFLGTLVLVSTAIVAYFIERLEKLLLQENYPVTERLDAVIWSWGMQFVLAIAAVAFIMFMIFLYLYTISAKAMRKSRLDALTKLYHREAMAQQIDVLFDSETKENCGTMIMLDVDRFKAVNDNFGHPQGDVVLCSVAEVLQHAVRADDLVGRLGGDEFCVFLTGRESPEDILWIVHRIEKGVHAIRLPDGMPLTCSIGIAPYLRQEGFAEFYLQADRALYVSKQKGRDCYSFFEEVID